MPFEVTELNCWHVESMTAWAVFNDELRFSRKSHKRQIVRYYENWPRDRVDIKGFGRSKVIVRKYVQFTVRETTFLEFRFTESVNHVSREGLTNTVLQPRKLDPKFRAIP